jgi:hypothetical protein
MFFCAAEMELLYIITLYASKRVKTSQKLCNSTRKSKFLCPVSTVCHKTYCLVWINEPFSAETSRLVSTAQDHDNIHPRYWSSHISPFKYPSFTLIPLETVQVSLALHSMLSNALLYLRSRETASSITHHLNNLLWVHNVTLTLTFLYEYITPTVEKSRTVSGGFFTEIEGSFLSLMKLNNFTIGASAHGHASMWSLCINLC